MKLMVELFIPAICLNLVRTVSILSFLSQIEKVCSKFEQRSVLLFLSSMQSNVNCTNFQIYDEENFIIMVDN